MNYCTKKVVNLIIASLIMTLFFTVPLISQEDNEQKREQESLEENGAVKVYLDRFRRDDDYIKKEIPFVNYVRDTRQAQVYILFTSEHTGGGGRKNTITFVGQKEFTAVNDTLTYVTKQFDTNEMRRQEMVKVLKIGLIRYVGRSLQSKNISIRYTPGEEVRTPEEVKDKWNYWIFSISPDVEIGGEESYKDLALEGRISANRVTEKWKTELFYQNEYDESENVTSEGTYKTFTREQNLRGLIVKSISDHWSVGINTEIENSSRNNTHVSFSAAPALEYNIFPYSQSTRRQLRLLFSVWGKNVRYYEETLYDKMKENLSGVSLRLSQNIYERWGNIWSSIEGNVYFHDIDVNKLEWNGGFNYRIFAGLSLELRSEVSLVHDQLFLPTEGSSPEEVLLKIHELKTDWTYEISFGFNYRFGSKFDNVVNPRFDRRFRFFR